MKYDDKEITNSIIDNINSILKNYNIEMFGIDTCIVTKRFNYLEIIAYDPEDSSKNYYKRSCYHKDKNDIPFLTVSFITDDNNIESIDKNYDKINEEIYNAVRFITDNMKFKTYVDVTDATFSFFNNMFKETKVLLCPKCYGINKVRNLLKFAYYYPEGKKTFMCDHCKHEEEYNVTDTLFKVDPIIASEISELFKLGYLILNVFIPGYYSRNSFITFYEKYKDIEDIIKLNDKFKFKVNDDLPLTRLDFDTGNEFNSDQIVKFRDDLRMLIDALKM